MYVPVRSRNRACVPARLIRALNYKPGDRVEITNCGTSMYSLRVDKYYNVRFPMTYERRNKCDVYINWAEHCIDYNTL